MDWDYIKARIEIDVTTECWNWTRSKTARGYGDFAGKWCNGHQYAHRVSYQLKNGPIAAGIEIRHKCDNPSCCNPDHLEPGTHKDNMGDMASRGRSHKWEARALKLTGEQVKLIREDSRPQKEIAKAYGICQQWVSRLKRNTAWKDYE